MLLTDWGQASSLLLICSLIYPAACGRSELAYAAPSAGRWRYMVWVQSHCFGYPEHTPLHCCVFCSVFSKQAALRVQWPTLAAGCPLPEWGGRSRYFPARPVFAWIMTRLAGAAGLAGWKWLFLLQALLCFGLGILIFLKLDDAPASAS